MIKNKRAESLLEGNLIYIILFVLFMAAALIFLYRYQSGTLFWEQYYSYTIAKVINDAQVGDKIVLNVDKAVDLAKKGGIGDANSIVRFDNNDNYIIVSLKKGTSTKYPFLRNYNIENLGIEESVNGFEITFMVKERVK